MRGEPVALSAREFALLEALLERPGAVLSRAQLEEKLYGWNEEVDSNAVEVHLSALRRKLAARHDPQRARRRLDAAAARGASVTRHHMNRAPPILDPPRAARVAGRWARRRGRGGRRRDVPPRPRGSQRDLRLPAPADGGVADRRAARRHAGGLALGDDALVVQVWDRNGVQLYLSQPQQPLPQYAQLGFTTVKTPVGDWRVFSTLAGDQVVQVAQPLSARRELAASMALRTIVPLLVVAPLLALLLGSASRAGSRRSRGSPAAVGKRTPAELEPLDEAGLPDEVRPLVHALNGLLARLDRALGAQRAFVADAAHELRTPLTAVHLQAQLAERADNDAERRAALAELKAGLARATHLVEQLLTLAREEPGVAERGVGTGRT